MRKQIFRVGVVAIGAVLIGFAWSASAQANTISYSHTTTSQAVPLSDSFSLNGFDPSLGILTGVTLELDTSATAEVDILNFSGSPESFSNATATIPVTATGPGPTLVTNNLMAGPISGTASILYPGTNQYPGNPANDNNSTSVAPADFGPYIGVGPIVLVDVSANTGSYQGTGNNLFYGGSAVAGAVTTVTYTYTVVPEPASMGLILAGLPLLAARRRRHA